MEKELLEFYDLKAKMKFNSTNWRVEQRPRKKGGVTYFAVTTSPLTGKECWRIIAKAVAEKYI